MNEDASKLDLLILSYCLRGHMRLHQLLRHDVDILLNMPHHRLDRTTFYRQIRSMLERDLLHIEFDPAGCIRPGQAAALKASGWIAPDDPPDEIVLRGPTAVQKLNEIQNSPSAFEAHVSFALTAKGSRRWEEFATPSWPLFVEEGVSAVISDKVFLEFRGTILRTMSLMAKMLDYYGRMPRCRANLGCIGYWQPEHIPWKRFRNGYRLLIDTGEKKESDLGEMYLRGGFSSGMKCEGRICELIIYFLSAWDLDSRLKLDELRTR